MRSHFLPTSVLIGLIVCAFAGTADAQPKKKGTDVADFDKAAAVTAITTITDTNLAKCKATNAAKGEGHVTITFATTGEASDVKVDKGPWLGSPVAKCMTTQFKKAKVPAFKGDAVTVGKTFKFGE